MSPACRFLRHLLGLRVQGRINTLITFNLLYEALYWQSLNLPACLSLAIGWFITLVPLELLNRRRWVTLLRYPKSVACTIATRELQHEG